MKVYRGFNNDIGPISYADWIYVTPDLEQAKWYANKDGQIKNGSIIQYDIDDNLNFFSIDNVNDVMKKYDESYSIDDLLWYQEGLSDYLYNEGADGIKFIDPKYKNHIIYILFDKDYLKNGKLLNDKLLDESSFDKEIKNILKNAGVQLNEEIIHAENCDYDNHMAVVLKNPTKRELRENGLYRSRFICFKDGTWLFFDSMQWVHENMLNQFSPQFGKGRSGGFYDLDKNQFIFIEPMEYDEGEEGYEEEFKHYIDKETKFLLSYPYIVKTFGNNFKIMVYGDWVDNPW